MIVVDSGSSDGGPALAAERGAELIGLDGNQGFGAGCNAGLELVTRTRDRLREPGRGAARRRPLAAGERRAARGALLAPRLLNADGSVQDSAHPLPGRLEALIPALLPRPLLPAPLRRRYEPWRSDQPRPVGWAIAACILAPHRRAAPARPFDPDAFLFYEDMELCLRARRAGIPTLLRPDVAVRHLGGASTSRALADRDLDLRAQRRREVVAQEGRCRAAAWTTWPRRCTFAPRRRAQGARAAAGSWSARSPRPARCCRARR